MTRHHTRRTADISALGIRFVLGLMIRYIVLEQGPQPVWAADRRSDALQGTIFITYNETAKKFDLQSSFEWRDDGESFGLLDFMTLHKNEEFDGHDIEIDLGSGVVEGLFAVHASVTSFEEAPFIHNVRIKNGHVEASSMGFIMRENARFYRIDSCTVTGELLGQGTGGIAGGLNAQNGGEIVISNCNSTGVPVKAVRAGGIIGKEAGRNGGIVNITNCHTVRDIGKVAEGAGGIIGSQAGLEGGKLFISNCSTEGSILSENAGGICAANTGEAAEVHIQSSHFRGNISGQASGGICGIKAGSNSGYVSIFDCSSEGNIFQTASTSGGICGAKAGDGGEIHIQNSHFRGEIQGDEAGGISGQLMATNAGKASIVNCFGEGTISALQNSGGLCGSRAGSGGTVIVERSFFIGSVISNQGGGIFGQFAGSNGGKVYVSMCYFVGNLHRQNTGGVFGSEAGDTDGEIHVWNSFSKGIIHEGQSGGFFGNLAGSNGGKLHVSMCFFDGEIRGQNSGGIFAQRAGNNGGEIYVHNSYCKGTISGNRAGGMFGGENNDAGKIEIYDSYASGSLDQVHTGSIFGWSSGSEQQTRVDHAVYRDKMCGDEHCSPLTNETSNSLADITGKLYCGQQGRCWSSDVWMIAADETYPVLQGMNFSPEPSPAQVQTPSSTVSSLLTDSASSSPMQSYSASSTPRPSPSSSVSLTETRTLTESATSHTTSRSYPESSRQNPSSPSATPLVSLDWSTQETRSPSVLSETNPPLQTSPVAKRMELPCQYPARVVIVSDGE